MKRIVLSLAVSLAVSLFAVPIHGQTCPTPPSPMWGMQGDTYDPDPACIVSSGPVTSTSLSCGWNTSDYEYYSAWPSGRISYTFTPLEDYVYFDADAFFDFDDPTDDWYNQIKMYATVTNSSGTTITAIFDWNGTMGDLSCARKWGPFNAAKGDTVTITIEGANFFANKIASSQMYIWAYGGD